MRKALRPFKMFVDFPLINRETVGILIIRRSFQPYSLFPFCFFNRCKCAEVSYGFRVITVFVFMFKNIYIRAAFT